MNSWILYIFLVFWHDMTIVRYRASIKGLFYQVYILNLLIQLLALPVKCEIENDTADSFTLYQSPANLMQHRILFALP